MLESEINSIEIPDLDFADFQFEMKNFSSTSQNLKAGEEIDAENFSPKYNFNMNLSKFNKLKNIPAELFEIDILDFLFFVYLETVEKLQLKMLSA